MWKWILMAACLFAAVNWFVLPTFQTAHQYLPHGLSVWAALGVAGIVMVVALVFGKGK